MMRAVERINTGLKLVSMNSFMPLQAHVHHEERGCSQIWNAK
uniref:Uncharacterized protein n=1 Tax=Rhizophora mucronata TaxID=61149 RepID=A0A2P2N8G9_RHIMU